MAEVEDVRAGVEDVEIDVEGGDSSDDEEKAQEESLAPIPESQEQGCIKSLIFFPRAGVYQVCWGRISICEEGKGISWLLGRI